VAVAEGPQGRGQTAARRRARERKKKKLPRLPVVDWWRTGDAS